MIWAGAALAADPPAEIVWLGHQRTQGARAVPVIGTVRTATDVYSIAHVERTADGWVVRDQPCLVEIAASRGVTLTVDPAQARTLPPAASQWAVAPGGAWTAAWTSGEPDARDFDGDGLPGLPIAVSAPLCHGRLRANLYSASTGVAVPDGDAISGTVEVELHREVLLVDAACLSLLPRRTTERVGGRFRFAPAPPGATCATVDRSAFPSL